MSCGKEYTVCFDETIPFNLWLVLQSSCTSTGIWWNAFFCKFKKKSVSSFTCVCVPSYWQHLDERNCVQLSCFFLSWFLACSGTHAKRLYDVPPLTNQHASAVPFIAWCTHSLTPIQLGLAFFLALTLVCLYKPRQSLVPHTCKNMWDILRHWAWVRQKEKPCVSLLTGLSFIITRQCACVFVCALWAPRWCLAVACTNKAASHQLNWALLVPTGSPVLRFFLCVCSLLYFALM